MCPSGQPSEVNDTNLPTVNVSNVSWNKITWLVRNITIQLVRFVNVSQMLVTVSTCYFQCVYPKLATSRNIIYSNTLKIYLVTKIHMKDTTEVLKFLNNNVDFLLAINVSIKFCTYLTLLKPHIMLKFILYNLLIILFLYHYYF